MAKHGFQASKRGNSSAGKPSTAPLNRSEHARLRAATVGARSSNINSGECRSTRRQSAPGSVLSNIAGGQTNIGALAANWAAIEAAIEGSKVSSKATRRELRWADIAALNTTNADHVNPHVFNSTSAPNSMVGRGKHHDTRGVSGTMIGSSHATVGKKILIGYRRSTKIKASRKDDADEDDEDSDYVYESEDDEWDKDEGFYEGFEGLDDTKYSCHSKHFANRKTAHNHFDLLLGPSEYLEGSFRKTKAGRCFVATLNNPGFLARAKFQRTQCSDPVTPRYLFQSRSSHCRTCYTSRTDKRFVFQPCPEDRPWCKFEQCQASANYAMKLRRKHYWIDNKGRTRWNNKGMVEVFTGPEIYEPSEAYDEYDCGDDFHTYYPSVPPRQETQVDSAANVEPEGGVGSDAHSPSGPAIQEDQVDTTANVDAEGGVDSVPYRPSDPPIQGFQVDSTSSVRPEGDVVRDEGHISSSEKICDDNRAPRDSGVVHTQVTRIRDEQHAVALPKTTSKDSSAGDAQSFEQRRASSHEGSSTPGTSIDLQLQRYISELTGKQSSDLATQGCLGIDSIVARDLHSPPMMSASQTYTSPASIVRVSNVPQTLSEGTSQPAYALPDVFTDVLPDEESGAEAQDLWASDWENVALVVEGRYQDKKSNSVKRWICSKLKWSRNPSDHTSSVRRSDSSSSHKDEKGSTESHDTTEEESKKCRWFTFLKSCFRG